MLFFVIANVVKQSLTPALSIDCRAAIAPHNDMSLTFYEFIKLFLFFLFDNGLPGQYNTEAYPNNQIDN